MRRLAALALDPAAVAPYLQNLLGYTVDDPVFGALPAAPGPGADGDGADGAGAAPRRRSAQWR